MATPSGPSCHRLTIPEFAPTEAISPMRCAFEYCRLTIPEFAPTEAERPFDVLDAVSSASRFLNSRRLKQTDGNNPLVSAPPHDS